uniref:Uncharacterized protein n=1 Tax=Arundo donax TaxID=35708 RepID=A0A0A8Z4A3_ARUDO
MMSGRCSMISLPAPHEMLVLAITLDPSPLETWFLFPVPIGHLASLRINSHIFRRRIPWFLAPLYQVSTPSVVQQKDTQTCAANSRSRFGSPNNPIPPQ